MLGGRRQRMAKARGLVEGLSHEIAPIDRLAKAYADKGLINLLSAQASLQPQERIFAQFALEHHHFAHAPMQQDSFALWACSTKKSGVYLEIGAGDGITKSHTYMLDMAEGWSGVLVEANPWAYRDLVKRRGQSICIHASVAAEGAPRGDATIRVRDRFHHRAEHRFDPADAGVADLKVKAPIVAASEILRLAASGKRIDFLSMRAHPQMMGVLREIERQQIHVSCMALEAAEGSELDAEIRAFMGRMGYVAPLSRMVSRSDLWLVKLQAPSLDGVSQQSLLDRAASLVRDARLAEAR